MRRKGKRLWRIVYSSGDKKLSYANKECVEGLMTLLRCLDNDISRGELSGLRQWTDGFYIKSKMNELETEAEKISDEKKRKKALENIEKTRKSVG